MRRLKKFAALGLSVAMLSSMAVGVQAKEPGQLVNGREEGSTAASAEADVDVDGYLTREAIVDPSGSSSNPYDPFTSTTTSVVVPTTTTDENGSTTETLTTISTTGNTPIDSNSSHVSWGDESTKDSTQVIITAPTKLSFQVAGEGTAANIQLDGKGNDIKGSIWNQSAYIDKDLMVVPKDVTVKGKVTVIDKKFELVKESEDFTTNTTAVKGVYLNLGKGTDIERKEFADMTNLTEIGTLSKGTAAELNGKYAVSPTEEDIYFSDSQGKATGVETQFADNYDGTNLKTNYNLSMVYSVQ